MAETISSLEIVVRQGTKMHKQLGLKEREMKKVVTDMTYVESL